MLIGFSPNLKDKRVDKMLQKTGRFDADIYYSPIGTWITMLLLILAASCGLLYLLAASGYYPFLIAYFLVGYLVCSYMNNSFAITEDEFIVVNPNFPFRQVKTYRLNGIEEVIIDKTTQKWHYLFCVFGDNYVVIRANGITKRYFCEGLALDAFDENWTEKTIEDLHHSLEEKGVSTAFQLEYD